MQRGLITHQQGKNPNQITRTIFLPADDCKNPSSLFWAVGFGSDLFFTWIYCPQGFSTTHKNFKPFDFMANITSVQKKCDICWIHCLYSIPATTWCNFCIKSNARPLSVQNLFFFFAQENYLNQRMLVGFSFSLKGRREWRKNMENLVFSMNSFRRNILSPTGCGLQNNLSFKPSNKKKGALLLAELKNPKEFFFFLISSIQNHADYMLYKAVTAPRLKRIF